MARIYNITDRLQGGKPVLEIRDLKLKLNNSLAAAIAIKACTKEKDTDEFDRLKKIVLIAFGKDGLKQLEGQEDFTLPDWLTVVNVVMAALQGVDLDEVQTAEPGKQEPQTPADMTSLTTGN